MSAIHPRRSLGARAEAVRQLTKLIDDAKHIRESEKTELRLCATQTVEMLWEMIPHAEEIGAILNRGRKS